MNRAFPPRDGEKCWAALPVARPQVSECDDDASAESYLFSVRQEACTIPDVLFAEGVVFEEIGTARPPPQPALSGWAASTLEAFATLHAYVASCESFRDSGGTLPAIGPLPSWQELVFGDKPRSRAAGTRTGTTFRVQCREKDMDVEDWPSSDDEVDGIVEGEFDITAIEERDASVPHAAPWLSTVMAMDQRAVREIIRCTVLECEARVVLGLRQAIWLYGLLCRLQRPLLATDASSVRQIFVLCTSIRHKLIPTKTIVSGAPSAAGSHVAPELGLVAALDTLILISGSFFGQRLSSE